MNSVIKLIAASKKVGDRIFARVGPAIIGKSHPLANVEDVFNAIIVKGDAIGDAMFYGRGAGKFPTASAVVADIIDIVRHSESSVGRNVWERKEHSNLSDAGESETRLFVRISARNKEEAGKFAEARFGKIEFVALNRPGSRNEVAFLTQKDKEGKLREKIESLKKGADPVDCVLNVIRVEEE
jgi:homoserine dehydrogenase